LFFISVPGKRRRQFIHPLLGVPEPATYMVIVVNAKVGFMLKQAEIKNGKVIDLRYYSIIKL
jgi:hypothetical protein